MTHIKWRNVNKKSKIEAIGNCKLAHAEESADLKDEGGCFNVPFSSKVNYLYVIAQIQIQPEDFVGPRMLKKYKAKQVKRSFA